MRDYVTLSFTDIILTKEAIKQTYPARKSVQKKHTDTSQLIKITKIQLSRQVLDIHSHLLSCLLTFASSCYL